MDDLSRFLKATRMRIESIFSCLIWLFRCANPILECLSITTSCNNYVCYTALIALKAHDTCLWYLDSGCSKHMIDNKACSRPCLKERLALSPLEMEASQPSEELEQ